jgi:outer membrane protein assembly factor BamB
MMSVRSASRLLLAGLAVSALSACAAVRAVNPFDRGGDAPPVRATQGQRVPVITLDQGLAPAEALKGVAFDIPPPQTVAQWPMPGGTQENSVVHAAAPASLNIAWRRDIGQGSSRGVQVTAPPVAADGRIYTMDARALVTAHDAASGAQVWRADLASNGGRDKEGYGGGLALASGRLYVTSGYRFVAALDARTGAIAWRTATESPVRGAPTVADGRLYAVSADNEILALDAATGAQSWSYQALVEPARFAISSSPAVAGDTVVAPFASGELVALRAQNGNELWTDVLSRANRTNALSEIRDIAGRPVIYQGDVYAASHSGVFSATDLRTGSRRWSLPVAGITTPWPAGDVVYVISKAGELICVARDSGQVYWVRDLNEGRTRKVGGLFGFFDREVRPTWSGPLLTSNSLVLVSTEGDAVAVNARTGAVERRIDLRSPAFLTPIAANGTIYVVTDKAELIALR